MQTGRPSQPCPLAGSSEDPPPGAEDRWAAVGLVAVATFVVVAAEMMPVGLLTPMGSTLQVSEGTVGLSLTITGLVAAATAPLVPAVAGRTDRKKVLVALMALVALSNAVTALAPTFAVLAGARVLLGVSMGGVWALAASLAPVLVSPLAVASATTLIFSGIAVASVLGVPLGTFIGGVAGWRASFWALAAAGALVAASMVVALPSIPPGEQSASAGVRAVLRSPGVRTGLTITALLVAAHFSAYTYVRPALEVLAGVDTSLVATMLLVYGGLGVVGTFVVGRAAVRAPQTVVLVLSSGIAITLLTVGTVVSSPLVAGALVAVWGLLYGGVSVSTQSWVARSAADRERVSALWVAVFNASIAVGALGGGQVYDSAGPARLFWVAAGLAAVALLVAVVGSRSPRHTRARPVR
ncbi:arabinose efflux permease family protein [Sanguibacter keddieii DSM 10542]|uniref:Arabinose efflux permease family protein n=1 Tax=Sanguibacter keddieii (strain ATCC 51767 / DSM 10542 / NCFB 3025 / ST-74) TaxID=446469 RepID=D1BHN8_SANKS|nr:MFS transporter [Sanguibacter keddieii]ACZ21958.1 arabinose efflux permease family protein [Sanguibacter keddieii DSM 10542]